MSNLGLGTIFFLQRYHILPPIFSLGPSIFPEYSRNIPTENLFHTLVEQKNGAFEGEKGSPNAFLRDLSARNLSRMRNQQSTQLISCLDIINTKWNRQTARICSVESSKRLEYEDIPDLEYRKDVKHLLYSAEYSGLRSCQTPPIFQKNMRNIVKRLILLHPRMQFFHRKWRPGGRVGGIRLN